MVLRGVHEKGSGSGLPQRRAASHRAWRQDTGQRVLRVAAGDRESSLSGAAQCADLVRFLQVTGSGNIAFVPVRGKPVRPKRLYFSPGRSRSLRMQPFSTQMAQPERQVLLKSSTGRATWLLAVGGLLIICVLLGMTWAASTPIIDEIAQVERSRLPKLELLQTAKNAEFDASVALRNVLLLKDPVLNDRELNRYARASESAKSALDRFGSQSQRGEEIELLGRALAARSRLQSTRTEAIDADRLGALFDIDALTVSLQKVLDDYGGELQRLHDYQSVRVTALVDDMGTRADKVRLLLIATGIAALITTLSLAASWRAELRRQVRQRDLSIASLRSQKAALIGEVHHRIKNHLQGLLGLLETHKRAIRDAPGAASLTTLHGHVLALIGIHGLQARTIEEGITLIDLVRQQVQLVRAGFPTVQLAITEDNGLEGATLAPDQAVSVALTITELVVNAIKHGAPSSIRIAIGLGAGRRPFVSVTNRLISPTGMDWFSGRGLGTGLSLISTLSEGIAELVQCSTQEAMTMTLYLAPLLPSEAT